MSEVIRWLGDPKSDEHPLIAELRSRPGELATIWEEGHDDRSYIDAEMSVRNPRVQVYLEERYGGHPGTITVVRVNARWIPDVEWPGHCAALVNRHA